MGISFPENAKVKSTDISAFSQNGVSLSSAGNGVHSKSSGTSSFANAKKMLEMNINLMGMPKKEDGMLEEGQDLNQQIPLESFRYLCFKK